MTQEMKGQAIAIREPSSKDKPYQPKYAKPHTIRPVEDEIWALTQNPSTLRLYCECWVADPYGSRFMVLNTTLRPSTFRAAKKVLSDRGLFVFQRQVSIRDSRETVCWMVRNLHGSRVMEYWLGGESAIAQGAPPKAIALGASPGAITQEVNSAVATAISAVHAAPISCEMSMQQGFQNSSVSGSVASSLAVQPALIAVPTANTAASTANSAVQSAPISPQMPTQQGFQNPSVSLSESIQNPPQSKSAEAAPNPEEEESKFEDKKPEGDWIMELLAENTPAVETQVVEPETRRETPKPVLKGDRLDRRSNRSDRLAANRSEIELKVHQWLVDERIDQLELNEPVRDKIAYGWALIDNEWETWEQEFAAIAFSRKQAELHNQLEARLQVAIAQWEAAGHPRITIYRQPDGVPAVLLDQTTLCAADFLALPVEQYQPKEKSFTTEAASAIATIKEQLACRNKLAELIRWFSIDSSMSVSEPDVQLLQKSWLHSSLRSMVSSLLDKYLPGVFEVVGDR